MLDGMKDKYNLNSCLIKSSLRRFIYEDVLTKAFYDQIHDAYYHGLQHGIGLLSHAAPLSYKYNLKTIYIPGSNSVNDALTSSASHPIIDEQIAYLNSNIIHEGFNFTRQDKIHNILSYDSKFYLRVCWASSGGENCNKCEKCMRTICGILAAGANPNDYGFRYNKKDMRDIKNTILYKVGLIEETLRF